MNKLEIDIIISAILSIITLIKTLSPHLAESPVIIELEKVITTLQALGL